MLWGKWQLNLLRLLPAVIHSCEWYRITGFLNWYWILILEQIKWSLKSPEVRVFAVFINLSYHKIVLVSCIINKVNKYLFNYDSIPERIRHHISLSLRTSVTLAVLLHSPISNNLVITLSQHSLNIDNLPLFFSHLL